MSAGLASHDAMVALSSTDVDAAFERLSAGGELAEAQDGAAAFGEPKNKALAAAQWVFAAVKKQAFVVCIALAIGLAAVAPFGRTGGPIKPEWSVSYGLIPIIFLLSGMSMKHTDLLYAVGVMRLNALVQVYNLAFIPLVMYGVSELLRSTTHINGVLLDGMVVCACVPTTLSTCNILTRTAGATQSIALFNSAFGNLFGLVYTPGMLLWLLHNQSSVGLMSVLQQLLLVLLLPLVVGQIVQLIFKERLQPVYAFVNPIIQFILVVIVFCAFCDTFDPSEANAPHASASSIAPVMVLTSCLYITFLSIARALFALDVLAFKRADQVAAWFCATQKTVAMGIPLLKIIYRGNVNLGLICVPLLTYHPTQLLVGSVLIPRIKKWMADDPRAAQLPPTPPSGSRVAPASSVGAAAATDGLDGAHTGAAADSSPPPRAADVSVSIYNRGSGAGAAPKSSRAIEDAVVNGSAPNPLAA